MSHYTQAAVSVSLLPSIMMQRLHLTIWIYETHKLNMSQLLLNILQLLQL